jgi:hypothetical protein
MILPSALMRQFEERGPIDGSSVPANAPYVLGIDLNRSESRCGAAHPSSVAFCAAVGSDSPHPATPASPRSNSVLNPSSLFAMVFSPSREIISKNWRVVRGLSAGTLPLFADYREPTRQDHSGRFQKNSDLAQGP